MMMVQHVWRWYAAAVVSKQMTCTLKRAWLHQENYHRLKIQARPY